MDQFGHSVGNSVTAGFVQMIIIYHILIPVFYIDDAEIGVDNLFYYLGPSVAGNLFALYFEIMAGWRTWSCLQVLWFLHGYSGKKSVFGCV